MDVKPPSWARAMVRLLADAEDREFLLDDLEGRFRQVAETEGPGAARRWYCRQALSAIPGALLPDIDVLRRRSWTGLAGDLRLGLRTIRRRPLYAVGVGGTLGLGLMAALITFAVAWRVWLAPLPIPDPDRVVRLHEIEPAPEAGATTSDTDSRRHMFSDALAVDFHEHEWQTIAEVGFLLGRGARSDQLLDGETFSVSSFVLPREGFEILGIQPTMGRLPSAVEEDVVLSERFWRSALGADPDIVGRRLADPRGFSVEIVGVAPFPAGYPGDADAAFFFDWRVQAERGFRWYEVFARLQPGRSIAEAEAEMNAFLAALAEVHPEHRGWRIQALPLKDDLVRPFRSVIGLLLAAGMTFLLLATVNVLGLVAARRVERHHERSIRLALGASEARLVRGTVVEMLVLAAAGTAAGILGARWLLPQIKALVPEAVPRLADVVVTAPLATTGIVFGLTLGCVMGLVGYAASRGSGPSVGRAPRKPTREVRARQVLVVGQVALTTLLTAGGVALLHRVSTLRAVDLGFEAQGVWVTSANLGALPRFDRSHEEFLAVMNQLLERLAARGMEAAASFNTPMSPTQADNGLFPFAVRPDSATDEVFYELHPVMGDYFSVMGIDVLAGRAFLPSDDASSPNVVLVSEDFANQYFPGIPTRDVPGRTVGNIVLMNGPSIVAGVVRATRHRGPDTPSMPDVYIPYAQQRTLAMVELLVIGDARRASVAVPDVLADVTPDVRWSGLVPYTSYLSEWYAPFRFQLVVVSMLAGLGLLLASLGLHVLMAYQVVIRRAEIGIRKALGASDERLMRGVVLPGVSLSTLGLALGLLVWYQLLPWTREFIQGADTVGAVMPLFVLLLVGLSCVIATLVPAYAAARVDPVATLNAD